MPKIVLIVGPPGVGKGTQAKLIEETFGLTQISTGELLRQAVACGSEVGLRAQSAMEAGGLVSDALMSELLRRRLISNPLGAGILLDGYPRTIAQADALEQLLKEQGLKVDLVLSLLVDNSAAIERITGRFSCLDCGEGYHDLYKLPGISDTCDKCGSSAFQRRADDKPNIVRQRLDEYNQQTRPLRGYYRESGALREVEASGSIGSIAEQIRECLAHSLGAP